MKKEIIGNILGGISALIGIYKFIGIYEAYRMFGPLLDNAFSQSMMNDQICIALVFCVVGAALLIWANFKSTEDAKKWYSNLHDPNTKSKYSGHLEGCRCRKCQEVKDDKWVDPYGV